MKIKMKYLGTLNQASVTSIKGRVVDFHFPIKQPPINKLLRTYSDLVILGRRCGKGFIADGNDAQPARSVPMGENVQAYGRALTKERRTLS